MIFYIGLNPRYQMFRWLPSGINVMYSAAGFWNGSSHEWRRDKSWFPRQSGLRFLDSGGFTMLNKYGDYPFTMWQFLNLVAVLGPDHYATLDYPCEPDISRNLGHMTNAERIMATVQNAWAMLSVADSGIVGHGRPIPVIQGYTLDEYKFCIEQHAKAGTLRDYMAVGSMCRRIDSTELHRLIPGIAEHAAQGNVTRLHWFGLKLSKDLSDLGQFIYSRDSAVVYDDYDTDLREARNGRRFPKGMAEKRAAFESFFGRLDSLGLRYIEK